MSRSLYMTAAMGLAAGAALLHPAATPAQRLERLDAVRLTGEAVEKLILRRGDSPQKHYPAAARREALDGIVVVDLLVNELGLVLEAQVVSESPRGQGFGLAALDTAKTFEFDNLLKKQVLISMTVEFLP